MKNLTLADYLLAELAVGTMIGFPILRWTNPLRVPGRRGFLPTALLLLDRSDKLVGRWIDNLSASMGFRFRLTKGVRGTFSVSGNGIS